MRFFALGLLLNHLPSYLPASVDVNPMLPTNNRFGQKQIEPCALMQLEERVLLMSARF